MIDGQRDSVIVWLRKLLSVSGSNQTLTTKMRQALEITRSADVVKPIAITIGKEVKRVGWDERSWPARFALSGALATAAVFGGEGAGVAAFGTAVGVPLWMVTSAGAAFAGVLVEELERIRNPR